MYDDAAAVLAARGARPLPFQPRFRVLEAATAGPVAAVDGSHTVLADTGAVWVIAWRAAAVTWPGPPPAPRPAHIAALVADEAADHVAGAYEDHGVPTPRVGSAEAAAEALRTLDELRAAAAALQSLPPDGMLLLDGALEGLPPHAAAWSGLASDPRVVAVAKRSSLTAGGVPLLPRLREVGVAALPEQAWTTPLPDLTRAHACLLHARARHAFRVDAAAPMLPRLLPLCRDAVYLGYPYPLAVAHNAVALTGAARAELRHGLEDATRRLGPGAVRLLEDPHAMLDANV